MKKNVQMCEYADMQMKKIHNAHLHIHSTPQLLICTSAHLHI